MSVRIIGWNLEWFASENEASAQDLEISNWNAIEKLVGSHCRPILLCPALSSACAARRGGRSVSPEHSLVQPLSCSAKCHPPPTTHHRISLHEHHRYSGAFHCLWCGKCPILSRKAVTWP